MSDEGTKPVKVVPIKPGTAVASGRVVNPRLVEMLELVLEKARAGEIQGAMVAMHYHDNCAAMWNAGVIGGFTMLGAVSAMHHRLAGIANSGDE